MYFGPALRSAQQYQLPSGYPPHETGGETDLNSIWATLVRRKRVFFAILAGFFSLVVLWTLVAPKSYTATTKLIAGGSNGGNATIPESALPLLNALLAAANAMTPETYTDLIQQDPVVNQVIANLHLHIDASALMSRHVQVKPVTNTSIIELSATWSDPHTAANIANEFGTVFVNRERELIAGQAGSAMDFLTQQMPVAEAAMRKADNALATFEAAHPGVYVNATTDNQQLDSAVLAAQQKYAQAEVDQQQAQAQLNNITGQLGSTSSTINGQSSIIQNPVSAQLQTQLAQVEVQLESARKQYTEQHPTVQALEQQKTQLEQEIKNQPQTIVAGNNIIPNPIYQQLSQQAATLRAQISSDQAQIKTLGTAMAGSATAGGSLPTQAAEFASRQRNAKMAEDIYTALQQKYSEAVVAKTTALSDVAVTSPASASNVDVRPKWVINLALGLALGLIMALSGVFLVDLFDNTLKDEKDVQRALPLPLLTTVPQLTTGSSKKLPWLRAITIEAFLQLVTALRYSSDKPLRTLAVISANQGDGKTTVAMSTAIAMAEIEPKVVLVDADLRRPSLHEKMGLSAGPGLSDVLVGEANIKEALQPTKYDGLFLLSSGTHVPNPMKLIHSNRFDELITELLKEHRAVVFDTPALLPVYDGAILSAKVDGAVFVISAGSTDMPSSKKAIQRVSAVQGVNLLGVVLNRATPTNGYAAYYLSADNPTPLPHENGVTTRT